MGATNSTTKYHASRNGSVRLFSFYLATKFASKPQPTPPTSSSFDIPRKPVTGEPDYSKIARGSYQGESYTVRKGDSMYLISYISGLSIKRDRCVK
ncbi:hypothetical protein AAUPMC_16710 [Pasteurella multocida subsp. multocida str. Anand1_cattle]|nr:hypothetical protein AAUPMC_16710 [Pasteurella multocida subsp. multocida str. Anand1_cattle]